MKKFTQYILYGSLIMFFLSGCNQDEINQKSSNPIPNEERVNVKTADSVHKQVNNLKSYHKTMIKHEVEINGHHFKLLSDKVVVGSQMFDLSVNQTATVKNSIVVVTKKSDFEQKVTGIVSINKIAKDTFSLKFKAETNMLEQYRILLKSRLFDRVELQLDYTPPSKSAIM